CAGESVVQSADAVGKLDVIAFAVLALRGTAPQILNRLRARSYEAADGFGDVDAVVELVHAGGSEYADDLAALLLGNGKELLHFIGVTCTGRPQDHGALIGQRLQFFAITQVADDGFVYKYRFAALDEGHHAAQVIVPVAAVYEADVAQIGQLGKALA